DDPRGVEYRALSAPGVQDNLDVGPRARLERAHAVEREPAVGATEQRATRPEQRSVQIGVEAAHGPAVWRARPRVLRSPRGGDPARNGAVGDADGAGSRG